MYLNLSKDVFDKENKENLKIFSKTIRKSKNQIRERANPFSAKILNRSKIFRDITNRQQEKATYSSLIKKKIKRNNFAKKVLNHNVYLEDKFTVEDPCILPTTKRYTTLNYINQRTKRIYKFYCFRDKDLEVPNKYAAKTISHSIDNDCNTDDGQIKGAVIKLFRNMEKSLQEIKEEEDSDLEDFGF